MKFKQAKARQGAQWVREGLRVFFRRPLAFCLLLLVSMFAAAMFMFATVPLATVGFMLATREALQGRFPSAAVFMQPLLASREQRWAQIRLGLAYSGCVLLIIWASLAVGGSALKALMSANASGKTTLQELEPLLADPSLQWAWLMMVGGVALLSVPFWFAPALVHWGRHGAAKSLFFSTVACWRNKGALGVYALGWGLLLIVVSQLSVLLLAVLGLISLAPAVLNVLSLLLSAAFYASLHFTFADSFEAETPRVVEVLP